MEMRSKVLLSVVVVNVERGSTFSFQAEKVICDQYKLDVDITLTLDCIFVCICISVPRS